jgi:hypothetical protein
MSQKTLLLGTHTLSSQSQTLFLESQTLSTEPQTLTPELTPEPKHNLKISNIIFITSNIILKISSIILKIEKALVLEPQTLSSYLSSKSHTLFS